MLLFGATCLYVFSLSTLILTDVEACTSNSSTLVVTIVNSTALKLTWNISDTLNVSRVAVEFSEAKYCNSSNGSIFQNSIVVPVEIRSYVLRDLNAWTCYRTRLVISSTSGNCSSATVISRTPPSVPGPPGKPAVRNVASRSVLVEWTNPTEPNGVLLEFRITFKTFGMITKSVTTLANETAKNVTGLSPFTVYNVTTQGRTQKGWGQNSAPTFFRTGEEAPSTPPQNITARNLSSTSIEVVWKAPALGAQNGKISQYVIRFREVKCTVAWDAISETSTPEPYTSPLTASPTEHSESNIDEKPKEQTLMSTEQTETQKENWTTIFRNASTYFEIINLTKPWACVEVQIAAKTVESGPFSNILRVRSDEDVPSKPTNFTVINKTSNTLSVGWRSPFEPHGIIIKFKLEYKCFTSTNWTEKDLDGNANSFEIDKLEPYQTYSLRISAATRKGFGSFSDLLTGVTDQDVPSAPSNLTITNLTANSLLLNWSKPLKPNGKLTGYRLEFKRLENSSLMGEESSRKVIPPEYTSYILGKLETYSFYRITLSAGTIKGYGTSLSMVVKTDQGVPLKPDNFVVKDKSAFHVSFTWKRLTNEEGIITGYNLKPCSFNESEGKLVCQSKLNLSENSTFYNFTRATPYTNYTFLLSGLTIKGEGNASVIHARTDEYIPSPARFLKVVNSSKNSLRISWVHPLHPNGIVYYRVFYREASKPVAKNNLSEITTKLEATVGNLEEHYDYILTVQAFTRTGGEALGKEVKGKTAQSAPSGSPLHLKAIPISSTSANLTWDHPSLYERNGIITDYEITYKESGNNVILRQNSNLTTHTLSKLKKYHSYQVFVAAVNVKGKGPAEHTEFKTLQDLPGLPSISKCENTSKNSIEITWNAPVEPNGEITRYNLTWRYLEDFSTRTERSSSYITEVAGTKDVTKLEVFSRYLFTVSAKTAVGWGRAVNSTCRTGESVPTEPQNVRFGSSTARSIVVIWDKPERSNGYLLGYKITFEPKPRDLKATAETKKTVNVVTSPYNITGLQPFTLYQIDIFAKTSIGFGAPKSISYTTNESIPSRVVSVSYDVNQTTVHLGWAKPLHEYGNVKYRIYVQMIKPEGKRKIFEETSGFTSLVTGLEEYVEYIVIIVAFTRAGEGPGYRIPFTTVAAAPSGPPLNFTAIPLSSTSIQLNWKPLSYFDRNGPINLYHVRITEPLNLSRNTTDLFLKWEELEEYQVYTLTVQAISTFGFGPPATTRVTTLEDKPGKPRIERYENISSTVIRIFWKPPKAIDLNGNITQYRIKCDTCPEGKKEMDYNSSTRDALIPDLAKYTLYRIFLMAATSKGWGPPDVAFCHTKEDKPDGPPTALEVVGKTSKSVILKWMAPQKPNGPIIRYMVRFYKINNPHEKTTRSFPKSPGEVGPLKPFERYKFEVACQSLGGEGPYSDTVEEKTNVDRPPTPTGTVPQPTLAPRSNGFYVRLWKASDDHGPVMYYIIVVLEVNSGNSASMVPQRQPSSYLSSELVTYSQYKEIKSSSGQIRPYIAGYLKRNEFPKDGLFRIGDSSVYYMSRRKRRAVQPYYNGELEPSSQYVVFDRAFVTKDLYVSSNWLGPYTTAAKAISPGGTNGGAIAGAIVGVLIFVFIGFAAFYFARRNGYFRKNTRFDAAKSEEIALSVIGQDNTAFVGDYRPVGGAISIENFGAHNQNLRRNGNFFISEEYKLIRNSKDCTSEASHHPNNRDKNRYTNIVAYDNTRVILSTFDDIPESDYINANYIDGYSRKQEYIATQGPLENTTESFWRMVWEQGTTIIVMLTRLEENGKIKCYHYWPEAGSVRFGCMQITTVESTELPDYCIRTFSVINNLFPTEEKFVKQFHFLAWPDHGVPFSQAILSFLRRVRAATIPHSGPTVVHCSAGVGRTGTYIVLDSNMYRIDKEATIDIFHYLQHLRTQRNLMVQTESQYVFIHDALVEFLNCGSSEIQVKDLRDYVKKLQRLVPDTEDLAIDKEFTKLNSYDRTIQNSFSAANKLSNKTKNRFLNILPFDCTRVCLSAIPSVPESDYINASFIDGYASQKAFIATQAPLPTTIGDFWRMVWEQHSTAIVCLVTESDNSKMVKVHRYWPLLESAMHGYFIIEKVDEKQQTDLIIRDLKITHTQEGHSRLVRQFHYTGWPDSNIPENGGSMIELIGLVQKWQNQAGDHTITVHCSTGVGRSGVFIAVFNMIQRLRAEGVIDVFQTVRKLRTQRPAMVQTKAQYLFCYIILQDYLASFDLHTSFM